MEKHDGKKLYLVSGFLGAGKTTFMHHLINVFKGKKVGVIVNEFGKEGIDGTLLKKEGISIEEISNGSIFCNCRSDTFISALIKISALPVDVVLIESSGLSDPANMGTILSVVQQKVEDEYIYKGAIAIADSTNIDMLINTAPSVKSQIESSDLVLINKIDLVNDEKIEFIKEIIKEINPGADIKTTSFGKIEDPNIILNLSYENSLKDINVGSIRVIGTQKVLVSMDGNFAKIKVEKWIKSISEYFYRIKGFTLIENKWHYVDGTSNQLTIHETEIIPKRGSLVILASGSQPLKKNMISGWMENFDSEIKFL